MPNLFLSELRQICTKFDNFFTQITRTIELCRVFGAAQSEDNVILACVVLTQYRSVKGGQTEKRTDVSTMAKTRLTLRAVASKNSAPSRSV